METAQENVVTKVEKKKVFICVPIEKHDDPIIERAIQIAKKDYCKIRGVNPKDIVFYDYLNDLKPTIDGSETSDNVKNEGLGTLGWMMSLLEIVDEVILGINWTKSRTCKVIAKATDVYMIPCIRMMKGEKKLKIENDKLVQEYRKKHNIEMVWKE